MSTCTQCGAPITDADKFCGSCGATISTEAPQNQPQSEPGANQPPPPYQPQQQYPQQPPPPPGSPYPPQYPPGQNPYAQPYQQYPGQPYPQQQPDAYAKYNSMGGWMLFFVILAMIGILINTIGSFTTISTNNTAEMRQILRTLSGEWTLAINIETFGAFLQLGAAVLQITFLVMLFQRKPMFLKIFQIAYLLVILVCIINIIVIGILGFDTPGLEPGTVIANLFSMVIGLLLYTLYYSRSVRVHVYMRGEEFKEKALFTFKQKKV